MSLLQNIFFNTCVIYYNWLDMRSVQNFKTSHLKYRNVIFSEKYKITPSSSIKWSHCEYKNLMQINKEIKKMTMENKNFFS